MTSNAGSNATRISAALSSDGRLGVVYTPGGSITLAMSKLSAAATARWYDPAAGAFTAIAGSPFANRGSHTFATPGKNEVGDPDWVLVLEAQ